MVLFLFPLLFHFPCHVHVCSSRMVLLLKHILQEWTELVRLLFSLFFIPLFGWQKCNLRCDLLFSRSLFVVLLFECIHICYFHLILFIACLFLSRSFISNAITKWWKVIYNLRFCVCFLRLLFLHLIFVWIFSSSSCCLTVCVRVCVCLCHTTVFFLFSH